MGRLFTAILIIINIILAFYLFLVEKNTLDAIFFLVMATLLEGFDIEAMLKEINGK